MALENPADVSSSKFCSHNEAYRPQYIYTPGHTPACCHIVLSVATFNNFFDMVRRWPVTSCDVTLLLHSVFLCCSYIVKFHMQTTRILTPEEYVTHFICLLCKKKIRNKSENQTCLFCHVCQRRCTFSSSPRVQGPVVCGWSMCVGGYCAHRVPKFSSLMPCGQKRSLNLLQMALILLYSFPEVESWQLDLFFYVRKKYEGPCRTIF